MTAAAAGRLNCMIFDEEEVNNKGRRKRTKEEEKAFRDKEKVGRSTRRIKSKSFFQIRSA